MANNTGKKIFIVDDDVMFTEMLRDYLGKRAEYEIQVFNTGEDCLKQLSANPDVIILDYYLNSVSKDAANGMQILEAIKKQNPQVHVVMLSSQERYGIALQTITKGAEQYVIKGKDVFEEIENIVSQLD
jgi:two-component system OmpR family response regulator